MNAIGLDALERWSWLVAEANGRAVVGMPGVRDPENRCDVFQPGTPGVYGDCGGDGHYVCRECSRLLVIECEYCDEAHAPRETCARGLQ